MPGVICSVATSRNFAIGEPFERRINILLHRPEYVVDHFEEPGFKVACVRHPAIHADSCIIVTAEHVLAWHGQLFDDDLQPTVGYGVPESLTQCLYRRFLERGAQGLEGLNGRYHVLVWARRARILNVATDRHGFKRLYRYQDSDGLHLACESKALAVLPTCSRKVDAAAVASMLSFGYYVGDLTLFQEIKLLPLACRLTFQAGANRLQAESYWQYPFDGEAESDLSEDELAEAFHAHLLAAVRRQIRQYKNLLIPITGGLDSRTLAGLVAQSGYTGGVQTYSLGQRSARDVRYGRRLAKVLGFPHKVISPPPTFIADQLQPGAWLFDAEIGAVYNWHMRSHVEPVLRMEDAALLSGSYGDIMCGAVQGFAESHEVRELSNAPMEAQDLVKLYLLLHKQDLHLDELGAFLRPQPYRRAVDEIRSLLGETATLYAGRKSYYAMAGLDLAHHQRRYTSHLSQSVEFELPVLTPFIDRDFLDFVFKLPYRAIYGKSLYQTVIRRYFPELARIGYSDTGKPFTPSPWHEAFHWRWQAFLARHPALLKRSWKRRASYDLSAGVYSRAWYFKKTLSQLDQLDAVIDSAWVIQHFSRMLERRDSAPDTLVAGLTPALYLARVEREACSI